MTWQSSYSDSQPRKRSDCYTGYRRISEGVGSYYGAPAIIAKPPNSSSCSFIVRSLVPRVSHLPWVRGWRKKITHPARAVRSFPAHSDRAPRTACFYCRSRRRSRFTLSSLLSRGNACEEGREIQVNLCAECD